MLSKLLKLMLENRQESSIILQRSFNESYPVPKLSVKTIKFRIDAVHRFSFVSV